MKTIAIIPARSGSKGLKNKNIKPLNNKPLMAYTIEAAKKSGIFDEIMVSTDSEEYAKIAQEYGASVPFYRTQETSNDNSSSWDVVKEVLNNYKESFDLVCLLQPTSPLRIDEDIKAAFDIYTKKNAKVVISVCETEHSPLLCGQLPNDGNLNSFINIENNKRRQDLAKYYRLNGAIYLVDVDYLYTGKDLFSKDSYAYIMPPERSVDIDTLMDFKIAELYLQEFIG
ncbi:CMP-N,N'-diacetyllegionaminic acid synthase [Pseudobutyrivibrio sp. AR14]|uniref:acylneuraminate cytidylyltransferase family protein n=1 Tax=Pseudobutyrivibrio sp. AR14 TaxID=1520804 RepID=UPI000883E69E|nr:acylneuraminate cytidylyltransferase family protein [Pseudobutyrivibrio sp. AR14]SCY45112.1 CMP-N,N'-diacetyllegionaminic acid synthase [Pseudobutyrivibrio sp. AR14]